MGKPPAFQFYPADFDLDTRLMSAEEVGVYVRLLCSAWVNGGIPGDSDQLARIAGVTRRRLDAMWPVLKPCWHLNGDGKLHNPRQEVERKKQEQWREKSVKGGRASAKARADQS